LSKCASGDARIGRLTVVRGPEWTCRIARHTRYGRYGRYGRHRRYGRYGGNDRNDRQRLPPQGFSDRTSPSPPMKAVACCQHGRGIAAGKAKTPGIASSAGKWGKRGTIGLFRAT
jgi:hypothetical protein